MSDHAVLDKPAAEALADAVIAGKTARLTIVAGGGAAQIEAFAPAEMGTKADTREIAASQLTSIIERVERLEEEKKALSDDIKDVYAEAKANGFDTKILRKIVALRKQDRDERMEEEALLDLYKQALGMA